MTALSQNPRLSHGRSHKQFVYDDRIKESTLRKLVGRSVPVAKGGTRSQRQNRTIMKGLVSEASCDARIFLHASDTIELCDYSTDAILDPSLKICLVYNGCIEGTIGTIPYSLDSTAGPTGYYWTIANQTLWTRTIQKNMRVSKVIITVPHSWLRPQLAAEIEDVSVVQSYIQDPTVITNWTPSKRALALGRSLIGSIKEADMVSKIRMESNALEILGEVIEAIMTPEKAALRHHRHIETQSKGNQIRDVIEHTIDEPLSLAKLAKDLGMGVNSLQRAFKAAHGMTVMEYIRERKLVSAKDAMEREGLTIAQAAHRAGYSSPANFSTAFKRTFGIAPSELRS